MTLRSLDQILKVLRDNQWHDLQELKAKTRLSNLKMQIATEFLARYGFIKLDRRNAKVKISKHLAKFYSRISTVDNEKVR